MKKLSWEEHIKLGHLPYRRDCRVCQEASARDRPHRRLRHPEGNVLSVDLTGPFRYGRDTDDVEDKRYLLVATYTWPQVNVEEAEALPEGHREEDDSGHLPEPVEEIPEEEEAEESLEVEEGASPEAEEPIIPEREEPGPLKTLYFTVPLRSKEKKEVLGGIQEIYIRLRREGMLVNRLHSDQGGEFTSRELAAWCRVRDIKKTLRSPDQKPENGRAEAAVGVLKSVMRRIFLMTGWSTSWWPCVARFASEARLAYDLHAERPKFTIGQEVLVPKRAWKQRAFEGTHQKAIYLTPMYDVSNGHAVQVIEGGKVICVSKVVSGIPAGDGGRELRDEEGEEKPKGSGGLEEEDLRVRRRIRVKTSDPRMVDDGGGDRVALKLKYLRQVIMDEEETLLEEEEQACQESMKRVRKLRQEEEALKHQVPENEDTEKVLHTKMISPTEVIRDKEKWGDSIKAEIDALMVEKKALRRLSPKEAQKLLESKGSKVTVVPGKAIFSVKAGSARKKTRLVVCGNHVSADATIEGDTYAGGTDTTAIRLQLKVGAERSWTTSALDIKAAFLNADLHTEEEPEQLVAMRPPAVMIKMGWAQPGELWLIDKAMYGLRQSPRRWSDHRDRELQALVWETEGRRCHLEQCVAEPNLWRMIQITQEGERLMGLVSIYVDDVLTTAETEVRKAFEKVIAQKWETNVPDELTEENEVRFLGMNIKKEGTDVFIHQKNYVEEVLERHQEEVVKAKSPMTKEMSDEAELPPGDYDQSDVTRAQRIAGELLWLMTRTRPDLLFSMSRLCSFAAKNPKWVVRASGYLLGYLRETKGWGIRISKDAGQHWSGHGPAGLQAFSDASFAPSGARSQGCSVVCWNGTVVAWKAGKQAFPALSTAECELIEAIDGIVLGDSVEALVANALGIDDFQKMLLSDNAAAVSIATDTGGAWRTRHLRLRAFHLRWRVREGEWLMRHCPGQQMLADLGTKPLGPSRVRELCQLWNLEPEKEERVVKVAAIQLTGDKEKAIKLLVALMQILACRAEDESTPVEGSMDMTVMVCIIAVVSVVLYRLVTEIGGRVGDGLQEWLRGPCSKVRRLVVKHDERATQTDEQEDESSRMASSSMSETPPRFSSARRRHGGGGSYVDVPPPPFERVDDAEDEILNQRWRQVMQIREQVLQAIPAAEPEATEVYHLTQLGDKLHWRRNCFGLRNATVRGMRAATPCSRCWTGEMQRRRGARTWCGADGRLHAIPTRPGIQGEARIYQPCRFCENEITQENHVEAMANGRWPRGMS